MIFVYKDCSKNDFNYKLKQYPYTQILFICECEDILVADTLAEQSGKINFKKGIPVGAISLIPLTPEQFKTFLLETYNTAQVEKCNHYKVTRGFEYKIYGLENPHLLIDYSYPQI